MGSQPDFTCILEPWSAQEVALIHSVLAGSGIHYFIVNENAAQLVDGVHGMADAAMRLMVETGRSQEARALIEKIARR